MKDESNPRTRRLLAIDQRPGALPQITSDGVNIAYALVLPGTKNRTQLVLRCDAAGDVWASICCAE
jgi:hypothetical protein